MTTPATLTEQERSAHAGLYGFGDLDERIAGAMGDRAAAWRIYRQNWKRGPVQRDFPLQIDVALNDACNLRCPMCTWSEAGRVNQGKASWMPLDEFTRIVYDGVPRGLCGIGLNGVNEPLLRPDLPQFVRVARQAGVLDIMLHTNGMLLTPRMSEALIEAGLTRLMVSLDAHTQETYDKIRVGGDLHLVRKNIAWFLSLRSREILPVLGVCFVKMAVNAHELEAFIGHWQGVADFFSIQSYMDPWAGAGAHLAEPGMRTPRRNFRCPQPAMRIRLGHDGQAHPCCAFWGDQIVVGNTRTDSVTAIWTGRAMRDLRQLHAEGRGAEHPVCRQCMASSYTETVA